MGRSPGFGYCSMRLNARLRLAFAMASQLHCLTSPHRATRRIIMQKARRHLTGSRRIRIWLRPLVSAWFQVLFHSPPGVLFTFPSRYWFTIGRQRVFSLGGWSPRIPTGFLVSRGTWVSDPGSHMPFVYGAITPCGATFQTLRLDMWFLTPRLLCAAVRSNPATPVVQRAHA